MEENQLQPILKYGSTTQKMIDEANEYVEHVRNLKMITPYYPSTICSEPKKINESTRQSYSTFVRIYRNNQWYRVHVVQNFYWDDGNFEKEYQVISLERIHYEVYMIQHLYIVQSDSEIDPLQISEEERLKQIIEKLKVSK